ncbi:MAG: hypothetical protein IKR92_00295 [Alphaproteobacteria bacterium]|nr:hypothetical protein [Alphaproteobacteria bacterium]
MKKFFATIIAIAAFGTVSNAQVVVYSSNPADSADFGKQVYGQAAGYQNFFEEKTLRTFKVELPIGNNTVTVPGLWGANREGPSIEAFGMAYDFDGHTIFGAGGGVTYLRKYVGGYANASVGFNADEARTSEHYGKKHPQLHVDFGIMSPALETSIRFSKNACPSVLSLRAYVGGNFKKVWDYKTDAASTVTTEETEDQIIITTTKKYGDLDAKPHVWGWEAGLRGQLDFGGSPLYLYAQGGFGKSQNFTYSEKQWHNAVKVKIGIGFRIFNGHGYAKSLKGSKNKYLYEDYGYTRKEVKKWNW